jgi:hypothetical protein
VAHVSPCKPSSQHCRELLGSEVTRRQGKVVVRASVPDAANPSKESAVPEPCSRQRILSGKDWWPPEAFLVAGQGWCSKWALDMQTIDDVNEVSLSLERKAVT